ncbi:MAG: integrase core domain-containing protein [Nitrospira sp.]
MVDWLIRECFRLLADQSLSGEKVRPALKPVVAQRGAPLAITVDNGNDYTSLAMDAWAHRHRTQLDILQLGKPVENGFIESFSGRMRDECWNVEVFSTLNNVREKLTR